MTVPWPAALDLLAHVGRVQGGGADREAVAHAHEVTEQIVG